MNLDIPYVGRAHDVAQGTAGNGATDRTRYGLTRNSPTSFYTHHGQQLSKAAVVYDAMAIRKQILSLRQRVMTGAHVPPASGASA